MADILSEGTRPEQLLQVIHSRTARSFDEGQGTTSRIETTQSEPWLIFVCAEGFDEAQPQEITAKP